jgi:hypothetical protein
LNLIMRKTFIEMSLGDELPSIEGEQARLVPLLSSIVGKQRARKANHKRRSKKSTR